MKSKFLRLLVITLLLVSVFIAGCTAPTTQQEPAAEPATEPTTGSAVEPSAGGMPKVYLLYPTLGFPFINALMEGNEHYAAEIGVELTIFDGQMDDNKQYEQAQQAINDKVDLVILTVTGEGGGTIMRQLQDAGIPCVILNQMPAEENEPYFTSAVVGDDVSHGTQLANLLIDLYGDELCNIVTIAGMASDSGSVGRAKGWEDTLAGKANYNIMATQSADWDKGRAMSVMEDFLVKFGDTPGIDVVFCEDDGMAAGAVEAIKAAGRGGGQIKVFGVGLNKEGIANIKAGEQYASAAHEPWDFAKMCFETVDTILKGGQVDKYVVPDDPVYTAENIDQYPYGDGTW